MKQQYYTAEQLAKLIEQSNDNIEQEEIRKLEQRKMLRESIREYKIQEDIVREQYQQSHLYQDKILITYRQLQQLEDPQKVSQILISLFDDDYLVVQNTAEQCIEWYYRTDKRAYITVINMIYEKHNDFQESLQKKLIKDVKVGHGKAYIMIKHLTPILDEQFLKEVYQYLLLHYCFCYIYDFKGSDNIMKSIYQLTDQQENVESQFIIQVYEQKVVICNELFQLSRQQLVDSISVTRLYLTPKLQFNQNFGERNQKEFNVQEINILEGLQSEIRAAFQIILQNPLLEAFISQIILNQKDLTKYIIDLLMDKLIIQKQNKLLQILINLVTNSELKSLLYQNNKKKPLMREILNLCVEERFQGSLKNEELLPQTFKIIVDLYKNGLVSKAQLLIYIKQSLKHLFSQIQKKEVLQIDQSCVIKSLQQVLSSIETINKIKDHEQYGIEKTIKQLIFHQQYNWFDIDNLITMETLRTILDVIILFDKQKN